MKNKSIPLRLWYKNETPKDNECSPAATWQGGEDIGWARWSLPIGNGYFGASVFARCETDRIQITEKTLHNPPTLVRDSITYFVGGLNNFSETYIDFGHTEDKVKNYMRYLDLETAIAGAEYEFGGVKYKREYFVSYPDKVLVVRVDADKEGALSFTLRPTIPFKQSYGAFSDDGIAKVGEVSSYVTENCGNVELSGKLKSYDVDFLGIYKVYTDGGTIEASTAENTYTDTDGTSYTDINGTIKVTGAKSAYIIASFATDYELSSEVFSSSESEIPTKFTDASDVRKKVVSYIDAVLEKLSGKSFNEAYKLLKETHISDHSQLFGRVNLDLGCESSDLDIPTNELLDMYKEGKRSSYLETLLFQYGRYLLIASSRKGSLPANLQGVWNCYNVPPWGCDYTHNINVQMNYWHAFSTNIAETFASYLDYNKAYMERARLNADSIIKNHHPDLYGKDGGNGWVMGSHTNAYRVPGDRSAGHLGFTTQMFWEYYLFTKDKSILKYVYDILIDAARYITKCTVRDANGNYLVAYCDSPEMYVNGLWHYTTGTTYAQCFSYANNYNALLAAKELGIDLQDEELLSKEEYSILKTVIEQIDHYDPVKVGLSGQIKEFREEDYYCSMGDEYHHRHVSQISGLYPCNIINSTTPAWLDAAVVTLNERGDRASGWGLAFRLNAWARTKKGNRTYKLVEALIKDRTAYNLWNIHPPFQIDGSFGLTAGIAEMLLESHEGYIAPLPAIPDMWSEGSYSGLVSRGNFVVDAEWSSGVLNSLKVLSKSGGELKICYPLIAKTKIVSSDGSMVKYKECGKDIISIDSEAGECYTVSGFEKRAKIDSPRDIKFKSTTSGNFEFSWQPSEDAVFYNVYLAKEDEPAYTHIATVKDSNFSYTPKGNELNMRKTFAFTAVGEKDNESERSLVYSNPPVKTEYGTIPSSEADRPFAIFKKCEEEREYEYIGSFDRYYDALSLMKEEAAYSYVIYETTNYDMRGICDSEFLDFGKIGKKIILDLAGRTLTAYASLFNLSSGGAEVIVRNGKLLTSANPLLKLSKQSEKDSKFDFVFENVTFGRSKNCSVNVPLCASEDSEKRNNAEFSAVFSDCTFDYLTTPETERITLFDFGNSKGLRTSIRIKGGMVKIKGFSTINLFNGKEDDAFVFEVKDEEKRSAFKLTAKDAPNVLIPTDLGDMKLEFISQKKIHFTVYKDYKLVF